MKYILFAVFVLYTTSLAAQSPAGDTGIVQPLPAKPAAVNTVLLPAGRLPTDSVRPAQDTVVALPFTANKEKLSYGTVLKIHPWLNFFGKPESRVSEERKTTGKEALFYIMAGLLFFFALVKLLFSKYVGNLIGLVFRGSLRQKQIREQLLQTPLPSLFLNIFFVIVGGLYIFFLLQHYQTVPVSGFWLLLFYCVVAVGLIYLVKFLVLKFTGWIFNIREAADTYIFIVFLVNKLLAIFLLPLLIIMSFSMSSWSNVLLTLSYIMVAVFFAYRYIVSFAPVRREVKVSQFHFFMYLCAFEVVPLLLIYKVLMSFF